MALISVRRLRSCERGQTLLEFAFASAVFFGTVLSIFLGGIQLWRFNTLSDLAQEGARWAAVRGKTSKFNPAKSDDPCGSTDCGSISNLTTFVRGRSPFSTVTVAVSPNGDPRLNAVGTPVTVTVSLPMIKLPFGSWTGTLTANASMMTIR